MYPNEQVFSAQESEGYIVVEPLAHDVELLKVHIDDIVVLAFTELPETRKIEVVATITGEPESDN